MYVCVCEGVVKYVVVKAMIGRERASKTNKLVNKRRNDGCVYVYVYMFE